MFVQGLGCKTHFSRCQKINSETVEASATLAFQYTSILQYTE